MMMHDVVFFFLESSLESEFNDVVLQCDAATRATRLGHIKV